MIGNIGKRYWEDEEPPLTVPNSSLQAKIKDVYENNFASLMAHPFLSSEEIFDRQMKKVSEIIRSAYQKTDFYRQWIPSEIIENDFKVTYEEFCKIRPVRKEDLFRNINSVKNKFLEDREFYETRSSGSSGQTLDILIDEDAVALDTVQGTRQTLMQSGLRVGANCSTVQICTVPWFIDNVVGNSITDFISSIIHPEKIKNLLIELKSDVISTYPSIIVEVGKLWNVGNSYKPSLIIVHSEQSSPEERKHISKIFGCPVLDEYSSEEATRIALQMPCGHYHTCDDTVLFEVLHPETLQPQIPGRPGVVSLTNLMNVGMPFIRYLQGDWAVADSEHDCSINWGTIKSLKGREGDSFIGADGHLVPSGTLLDICYRTMYDCGISFPQYELIQKSECDIEFRYEGSENIEWDRLINYLKKKLEMVIGRNITLIAKRSDFSSGDKNLHFKKRRPIRREIE